MTFGHAFQHSVISAEGQINAAIISQPFKYDPEMYCHFSPKPHMGVGKNTHGSLVIVEHLWNPLCTNFSFPHAVGEDTISTSWRDSHCRSNCRA